MDIDADVAAICQTFHPAMSPLVQAVVNAEGSSNAIVRAVRCSDTSVTTREQAIRVVCRSAIHALYDYTHDNHPRTFVLWWAARWAPPGAKNDPTNLNANWPKNVTTGWLA